MNTNNRFIQLNFACIYLIWGSTYLVIQTALEGFPPYTLIFLRLLAASSLLFLIAIIKREEMPTRRQVFNSFFLSIFFFILCNAIVLWTQQYVNSGIVALMLCSQPLFIALLQSVVNKEKIPPLLIGGLVFGIGGIGLLQQLNATQGLGIPYLLLLLFASFCGATGAVLSYKVDLPSSAFINSGFQMGFASTILGSIALLNGELQSFAPTEIPAESWYSFLYLVFFGSIVAYTSYNYLCTRVSPNLVATHSFVNPLVAITLGATIGGEVLDMNKAVPAILLIGSVIMILYSRSATAKEEVVEEEEEAEIIEEPIA